MGVSHHNAYSRNGQTLGKSRSPSGMRELQTERWKDDGNDFHRSVVARFSTEYGLAERFAQRLKSLVAGNALEAILECAGGI